jgi:hypothetical protein
MKMWWIFMRMRIYRSIVSRLLTVALVALGSVGIGVGADPAQATGATPQTITILDSIPTVGEFNTTYSSRATASSGLPVLVTVEGSPSPACWASQSVSFRVDGRGTCTITFEQAGDDTYAAAAPITVTMTIAGIPQSITPGPSMSIPAGGTGQITATSNAGQRLYYAVITGGCSVSSTGLVTGLSVGSCTVSLDARGTTTLEPAERVLQTITVTGLTQSPLSLTVPSRLAPGASGTVLVSGGSGTGATTMIASGDCVVSGTTVTANTSGTSCTISVTKESDSTYLAATAMQTFSIAISSGGGSGGVGGGNSTSTSSTSADSGDIVFVLDQDATKKAKPSLDAFDIRATTGGVMIFKGRNLLSVVSVTVGKDIPVKILKSTDVEIDLELPKAALAGWQTIKLKTVQGEKSFEKAVNYVAAPAKPVVKILKGFKTGQTSLTKSQKVALKKFVKSVGKYKLVECRGLSKPIYMTCKYLKTIYKAGRIKVTKLKLKATSAAAKEVRLVFNN